MSYDIIIGRNESDMKKFGTKGTILLAKQYVTMGRTTTLSNKIFMDVAKAHVVFVAGKRGSGKCVTGDTLIQLEDGSQVKIEDLEKSNKKILALDSEHKLKKSKWDEFYKRNVKELLEITLRSGKKIKLTPEHPLLTIKGWIPANKLKKSGRIATPRVLDCFGNKKISKEKIKIISYLIAEGHLSNHFVLFSNKDEKIVKDFKKSIKEFDKKLLVNDHGDLCYRVVSIEKSKNKIIKRCPKGKILVLENDNKNSLIKYLGEIGLYDKLSKEKFIPKDYMKISKKDTALFLSRLFSCDGSIFKSNNYWAISYSSISEKLINQVHNLLLRFGILSRIRTKKGAYEIEINSINVINFIKKIGFYGEKEIKSKKALEFYKNKTLNPNVDTIPKEIWEVYKPENWAELGRKIGYKFPKSLRESKRYAPSREKLLKIGKADNNELIQQIAQSDIFWDEIVKVKKLKGNFKVYDISVPKSHNFIANDIIIHNSYTMGAIAEGAASLPKDISGNLSFIILDTMGIYWTMKYPNIKDKNLLAEWEAIPKGLDVVIFTPAGFYKEYKEKGIPTDKPFSIKPSELQSQDWFLTFGLNQNEPLAVYIEKKINELKTESVEYAIPEIIEHIKKDTDTDKTIQDAAINRFSNANLWGLFDKEGTTLKDLAIGGKVTVLDVSCYATMPNGWNIKSLVVGLVAQKLFNERMIARKNEEYEMINQMTTFGRTKNLGEKQDPLVWLVIDEAHEFLPVKGETAASGALITILREGRQPGISLILATQQPGKIHTDVMTQSDIILAHRLTSNLDIDALKMLSSSFMSKGIDEHLRILPHLPGVSLIIDDQNEKVMSTRMRPRTTWHGGEAPIAIKEERKLF